MSGILITGSADGLGQLAAKALVEKGHKVILHARSEKRAKDALKQVPGAEGAVSGDLSSIEETKQLAAKVNTIGDFDAVIHNAGIYTASGKEVFYVNVLAPYVLTCLIKKPQRLIYLSSAMHLSGVSKLGSPKFDLNRVSYSDTKLYVLMLSKAVARKWVGVYSNAVNPGWVPTKMGGKGAPDSLQKGYETQVWLAAGSDEKSKVSGRYFFHQNAERSNAEADDPHLQDRLLKLCEEYTGVSFPG